MNFRQLWSHLSARRRKQLAWAAGAFLAYTLIGFVVVPQVIKWQMLTQLPGLTKRQVGIRQVRTNPLTLSLTIRDLALKEPDGRVFVSFEEFYINFQMSSLFRWAWTFKDIRLVRPYGEVILMENGQMNFANMFAEEKKTEPEPSKQKGGIPRVNIFHLQLTNGFVAMQDRTRRTPFSTEYRPINFVLSDFSTRPDSDTPYSFRAESDAGRSLTWKGDFSVQPLKSSGSFELVGLRLNAYQPYIEDFTKALLTNGIVDMRLTYRFAAGTNGIDLLVTNGTFVLDKLDIRDPRTFEAVAGVGRVEIQGADLNLRERSARLRDVHVGEVSVQARIDKEGRLNLQGLMVQRSSPSASPGTNSTPVATNAVPVQPWAFAVDHLSVTNAGLVFEDFSRATPFKTEVRPIEFNLDGFNSRAGSNGGYNFQMVTESQETLAGSGSICVNPPTSRGEIALTGLELRKYMPYAEGQFIGKVVAGRLNLRMPYRFMLGTNGIQAGVSNLAVALKGLEVKAGEETVAQVGFNVERVEASLEDKTAKIGVVNVEGSSLMVRRDKDGSINLLKLIKSETSAGTNTPANTPAAEPPVQTSPEQSTRPEGSVLLEELNITGCKLKVEDQQPKRPAAFELDQVALKVKGASTDRKAPISMDLGFRLNQTGTARIKGKGTLEPAMADVGIELKDIDIKLAQSYLDPVLALSILSGYLSTQGDAHYEAAKPGALKASYTGDVQFTEFSCADTRVAKELASWEDLRIEGITAEMSDEPGGKKVKIANINWVNPKTTVVIGSDGTLNLPQKPSEKVANKTDKTALAKTDVPEAMQPRATQPAPESTVAETFSIEIGTIKLENGTFGFSDLSIQPNSALAIQSLGGTIKGISSAMNTTADVDLAGTVGERSPFFITGKVNPLGEKLFVDLVVSNSNAQLSPFTGYMEKYAGHPLNKGRLTTSFHYVIEDKALKAENKIQIDQLTLGARNNSPDATSLPVKLGVALLKDSNGRIELDVPVSGHLDDPQFKVGPIILKVVMNMLAKAATSPFKLLGALVGGGEELSFVEFSPGTTNLAGAELEKLDKLKKALAARPALSVEIQGWIDPDADRSELALVKLKEGIKSRQFDELKARGKNTGTLETFQMDPEEYQATLRSMVVEQFGTNVAAVIQSNLVATAAAQANTDAARKKEEAPRGILGKVKDLSKRIAQLAGFGPRRNPVEKKLTRAEREVLGHATPEMMERLLADTSVNITPEEYSALMNARAKWVQDWLLQQGEVAADRLLLLAPKNVDASYTGQSRAILSLN